jgi:threonine/homoserine/homoserine lactone efflux protein
MDPATVFLIATLVSFVGSIPPGTINVSVMQLSMLNQRRAALFLGLGAATVEFVYAGITVKFQQFLMENRELELYFQVITASVLVILGIINLFSKTNSNDFETKDIVKRRTGFKKGALLGILNPLTLPYWLVVTTYLETHQWVQLQGIRYWAYISGISVGTFLLMIFVDVLGNKFKQVSDNSFLVHKVPGLIFLGMGLYNFYIYFF